MVEAYPQDTGGKKITASLLYSVTRSLFEQADFDYIATQGEEPHRDAHDGQRSAAKLVNHHQSWKPTRGLEPRPPFTTRSGH